MVSGDYFPALGVRAWRGRTLTEEDNLRADPRAVAMLSFRFWRDARKEPSLSEPALRVLKDVGQAGRADVLSENLAQGEQRQVEVAMALATRPRLLLLDETMAGMGTEESQRMIALLTSLKRKQTIVLVEHDMRIIFRVCERIQVLDYGKSIAVGSPDEIRTNKRVVAAYLGAKGAQLAQAE